METFIKSIYNKIYHVFILPGILITILITSLFKHQEYTLIVYGILAPVFLISNSLYQFHTLDKYQKHTKGDEDEK